MTMLLYVRVSSYLTSWYVWW